MDGSLAEAQSSYVFNAPRSPLKSRSERIGVIGLGYVGLPVSVALANAFETVIGFDIDPERVNALRNSKDRTNEIDEATLMLSSLTVTTSPGDLSSCSIFVVAVPTPVNKANQPDLSPLKAACRTIAPLLKRGDIIVFESTVFPGATEEVCGPELQLHSGLTVGVDFHLAYSPERITPGDKLHKLEDVPKIVSGDTPETLERVAQVYERIVPAGIHRAASIKVAEAAKVFENTQRDVNIALMNEFSMICDKLGIRSRDVIRATGTKWNALPFTPGLVGGHCIGVDPFYLTHKAEENGVHPEIMHASRRRNNEMASNIANRAVRFLSQNGISPAQARVGILGITFKEDVPDLRNSKVLDIIDELQSFGIKPIINDPLADTEVVRRLELDLSEIQDVDDLDLLLLAVPHRHYLDSQGLQDKIRKSGVLMDVRSMIEPSMLRSDITYWSL